jgi:hypothetical protein
MIPEPVPDKEWLERTAMDREPLAAMADPVWRIANLYTIYSKRDQATVRFSPKPEQRRIIWDLFVLKLKNIIIPKARQIGFSTLLAIIAFDFTLFNSGAKCALVDKTALDGEKKFNDIVRVAWDRLPAGMRAEAKDFVLNTREFAIKLPSGTCAEDVWSRFRVEKSGRGDALVFLWVSEWGTIQFDEPKRSTEILTGGMEAAEGNIRIIETTWKGGEGGDVWAFIEIALSKADKDKTPADWFIRFFPWWVEKAYTAAGTLADVRPKIAAYLDAMEAEISTALGRHFAFSVGQRCWYDQKERTLGLFIKREYPTILSECWEAPVEGAIYAEAIAHALAEGRMQKGSYDPRLPVYTTWDLGAPQNLVCWYFQIVRGRIRFIDVDMGLVLTTRERVDRMKAKGYNYAKHLLPHDADSTGPGSLTYRSDLVANGLENTVVVPRPQEIETGINRALQLFHHFEFDPETCAGGIKCLKAYHRHEQTNEPVHDWSSHPADAIRVMAEAASYGIINLDTVEIPTVEHARYFDTEALQWFERRVVEWNPRLAVGVIEQGRWVKREPKDSWLRMWEEPCEGQAYLLAAVQGVVGVFRKGKVPILCAALMPEVRPDLDRLSEWISAISKIYGRCLVVPGIEDASGLVELLARDGSGPVWLREEAEEARTVGRGRVARKPGFKMTDLALGQILATLRGRVREKGMEIAAGEFLNQAKFFIEAKPGELPCAAPGHEETWVRMCALAAHCIESATLMPVVQAGQMESDWGEGAMSMEGSAS